MFLKNLFLFNLFGLAFSGSRTYYVHPRLNELSEPRGIKLLVIKSCTSDFVVDMSECRFYIKTDKELIPVQHYRSFSVFPIDENKLMLYEYWTNEDGNNFYCQPYSCSWTYQLLYDYYGRAIASCDPNNSSKSMIHLKLKGSYGRNGSVAVRNICNIEDLTK